jgi:hypothetical protein
VLMLVLQPPLPDFTITVCRAFCFRHRLQGRYRPSTQRLMPGQFRVAAPGSADPFPLVAGLQLSSFGIISLRWRVCDQVQV